jgi:AraC-like DNA-binding protein
MKGRVRVQINESHYLVEKPTAVFVSNFETHSFTALSHDYSRFCISLRPALIKQEIKSDRLLSIISNRPESFCHCVDIEAIEPLVAQLLREMLKETEGDFDDFPENASALFKCILIAIYRQSPKSFPFDDNNIFSTVQRIKHKIESDLATEQSLDELAEEFHVSRYYLAHSYKKITGYSIKNYKMLCRLAEARELLTETAMPVSDISERVGFPDTSNFSKYFTKKEGYTPSEYRTIPKGENQ